MNIDKLKAVIHKANPELTRAFKTRNGFGEKMDDTVIDTRFIRLADVLLAAGNKITGDYWIEDNSLNFMDDDADDIGTILWGWNLSDDNLDNQSDECKKFLTELLT